MPHESGCHRHVVSGDHTPFERRGATTVLVAITIVVLFGFTAFAVDFGRAYLSQAQLQTSADAAALAGAMEIRDQRPDQGEAEARAIAAMNKVQATDPDVVSVEPGFWDDDARAFTPAGSWNTPNLNAVRAVTRHRMGYTFARVMGFDEITLSKPAVAAVGSATWAECMKPWGIPFQAMALAAGRSNWENDVSDLTPSEIEALAGSQVEIEIKVGPPGQGSEVYANGLRIPGNFQALALDGRGANNYEELIAGDKCSQPIRVDDRVETEPGNMVGPTWKGTSKWCLGYEQDKGTCPPARAHVILPIFDDPAGQGRTTVRVRYIGAFVITRWDGGRVWGYFTVMSHAGAGGFSPRPGPVSVTALVQ